MDMSEALGLLDMMSAMGDSEEIQMDTSSDGPMDDIFNRIQDGTFHGDTIINTNDIIKGMIEKGEDASDVPKNVKVKIHYDKSHSELDFVFVYEYSSLEEIKNFNLFKGEEGLSGEMGGFGGQSLGQFQYTLSKGKFIRKGQDLSNSGMLTGDGAGNMDIMSGLSSNTTYTTIYHLPGKVISTSEVNAHIDGKVVTIKMTMKEYHELKKTKDIEINYKKRKKFLGIF